MNKLSEELFVISTIDPDAYGTGDQDTDVIDMRNHNRVMFVVLAGTLGSSGTVDFGVYGDTDSGGAFDTLVTGKSATQLTQAGTDSDKQVIVEVSREDVMAQGFTYIQGRLTVGTAGSDAAVLALAGESRYSRIADLSTVDEIVR